MNDKDNKLIALFMGLQEDGVDGYLVDMDKDYGYQVIHESCFLYDSSWDWLMPVVVECFERFANTDTIDYMRLNDALLTCNIDELYQVVVEFIKEHNDERQ